MSKANQKGTSWDGTQLAQFLPTCVHTASGVSGIHQPAVVTVVARLWVARPILHTLDCRSCGRGLALQVWEAALTARCRTAAAHRLGSSLPCTAASAAHPLDSIHLTALTYSSTHGQADTCLRATKWSQMGLAHTPHFLQRQRGRERAEHGCHISVAARNLIAGWSRDSASNRTAAGLPNYYCFRLPAGYSVLLPGVGFATSAARSGLGGAPRAM